jgi:glyoxylate reductase
MGTSMGDPIRGAAARARVVVARRLLPAGLAPLEELFEVRSGGLDAPERIRELAAGAAAIVVDPSVRVDAGLLDAAGPQLQVVANFAVGIDNLDLDACRARGVTVTNTPDVLTNATAELALALTLAAARFLSDAERDLRAGRWKGWDPGAYRGLELSGARVGIVGLGRIGRRYAELLRGFEVELLYWSRSPKPEAERELGARRVEMTELLRSSDVVSLHAPATPETHHLIDADALEEIGREGILVNTARGPLVDLTAVAAALREGRLGAAGLDVYEGEPDVPRALLEAPHAVLTPHIGSATGKARDAMARTVADNVIAVLEGREPPNRVQ